MLDTSKDQANILLYFYVCMCNFQENVLQGLQPLTLIS